MIYEWGSYKGYGGDVIYERHNRIFECIMAIAFACNLFLALFSAYFWLFSITANSSQDYYVYRNLTSLTYCFGRVFNLECQQPHGVGSNFVANFFVSELDNVKTVCFDRKFNLECQQPHGVGSNYVVAIFSLPN